MTGRCIAFVKSDDDKESRPAASLAGRWPGRFSVAASRTGCTGLPGGNSPPQQTERRTKQDCRRKALGKCRSRGTARCWTRLRLLGAK